MIHFKISNILGYFSTLSLQKWAGFLWRSIQHFMVVANSYFFVGFELA
jgi:hypothetical protein